MTEVIDHWAAAEVSDLLSAPTSEIDPTLRHPRVRIASSAMDASPIRLARAWAAAHPDVPACEVQVRRPQRKGKGGWGMTAATWTLHAAAGRAFRPVWPRDGWCSRCGTYTRAGTGYALLDVFAGVAVCPECLATLANCAHERVSVLQAWRCSSAEPLYDISGCGDVCLRCLHTDPPRRDAGSGPVPEHRLTELADLVLAGAGQASERLEALRERFGKSVGARWSLQGSAFRSK